MTWCNENSDEQKTRSPTSADNNNNNSNNNDCTREATNVFAREPEAISLNRICPSCGHEIKRKDQKGAIHDLPGLPAGVKFDPTDQELLEHLEGKVRSDQHQLHRLIDEFIPILEGENGICYTHPERLPGVSKNGQIRHFFHRPSKAYTTGNRKRRKVLTDEEGGETRWHKTGKTRPVYVKGELKGYKKILVLYTNYGKQKKPEKTNWVMHQYHLGNNEEEKDGELVVSKVFYQTQPRQCGSSSILKKSVASTLNGETKAKGHRENEGKSSNQLVDYYNASLISFNQGSQNRANSHQALVSHFALQDASSYR